jgi:hypothetical protein
MKTYKMSQARYWVVIEAFTDYLEHYCEKSSSWKDPAKIVKELYNDFTNWALEDELINHEERNFLMSIYQWELRKSIAKEVANCFMAA